MDVKKGEWSVRKPPKRALLRREAKTKDTTGTNEVPGETEPVWLGTSPIGKMVNKKPEEEEKTPHLARGRGRAAETALALEKKLLRGGRRKLPTRKRGGHPTKRGEIAQEEVPREV